MTDETPKVDPTRKLELNIDIIKWIGTTLIIGGATTFSTWILKDKELKMEDRREEFKYMEPYLKEFMNAYDTSTGALQYDKALTMANFVAHTTTSEEVRKAWTNYVEYLKAEQKALLENFQAAQKKAEEPQKAIINYQEKIAEITSLKSNSAADEKKKKDLLNKIDSASAVLDEKNKQVQKAIDAANKQMADPSKLLGINSSSPEYIVIYEGNRWAGREHFNQVTDEIAVSILDYKDRVSSFQIEVANPAITTRNLDVSLGEQKQVSIDPYIITIKVLDFKNMGKWYAINKEVSYHIKIEQLKSIAIR